MARPDPDPIPNFVLIRRIDSGAYGDVWLARDSFTGVHRAIKVIWFEPESPTPTDPKHDHRANAEKVFRGLVAYLQRFHSGRPLGIPILAVHRHPSGKFFYCVMPLADDATAPDSSGMPGFDPYQPLNLDVLRRRHPPPRRPPAPRSRTKPHPHPPTGTRREMVVARRGGASCPFNHRLGRRAVAICGSTGTI